MRDHVEQAVGDGDVEPLGPAGQETDDRQQQDREGADRVARQHAVEHRRPLERAHHGKHEGNQDGASSGRKHQCTSFELADARVHASAFQIERALPHQRMHGETLPLTPVVMVPGVSVIELA